eukprot:912811-Pelagomonas_calceolata.AAC.1
MEKNLVVKSPSRHWSLCRLVHSFIIKGRAFCIAKGPQITLLASDHPEKAQSSTLGAFATSKTMFK